MIGAGVVGLAVARQLAQAGHDTVVLEAERHIGTGTSSRNSEVIHAGIYYPQGSFKALLCVAGRGELYDYCESHGVEHRRCGKLIVAASEEQLDALDDIAAQAVRNGVTDLVRLSGDEMRALEPELHGVAALLSPSTGIVDSHGLMLALQGDLEAAGGMVALQSPVISGAAANGGVRLRVGGSPDTELHARYVVNAAGLTAQRVAATIAGVNPNSIPALRLAKGNYFSLSGRTPFSRLVYPVPEPGGLGIHLTLDLGGRARFGPDVEWIDELDYDVDPARAERFYASIRRYWPGLADGTLSPAYAGVRPKLSGPGQPNADFVIHDATAHGVHGLVNLYGIESPGLTSALAIARHVQEQLGAR